MLAFMKVLQPKTVEEAYELATKNKTAPMLAGGCWLRLGRRTWPSVIDMASLDLRYVREEDKAFVIGAMATQGDVERFEPLQQFCGGAVVKGVKEILGVQFRNTATMGGSVASKFGFSDIIPALLAVHADIVTFKGGRMSMQDYMTYRERDILVEIRIPKVDVAVAVEALRISRGDFPLLTGALRHDEKGVELYIGTRPGECLQVIPCFSTFIIYITRTSPHIHSLHLIYCSSVEQNISCSGTHVNNDISKPCVFYFHHICGDILLIIRIIRKISCRINPDIAWLDFCYIRIFRSLY